MKRNGVIYASKQKQNEDLSTGKDVMEILNSPFTVLSLNNVEIQMADLKKPTKGTTECP